MLQFWKKSGQKDKISKSRSQSSSPAKSVKSHDSLSNGDVPILPEPFEPCRTGPLSEFQDELPIGDLGASSSIVCTHSQNRSRLSKTLSEVLADKGALGYFIQYLEACDSIAYIKFWLDVESYRAAACARVRTDTLENGSWHVVSRDVLEGTQRLRTSKSSVSASIEDVSVGTDCDSSIDLESVFESPYLAGGEGPSHVDCKRLPQDVHSLSGDMSRGDGAGSEGAKYDSCNDAKDKITVIDDNSDADLPKKQPCVSVRAGSVNRMDSDANCKESPGHGALCLKEKSPTRADKLVRDIVNDAVRIYKKYIAHDAPYSIHVSDDMRNRIVRTICNETGVVDPECFTEAQNMAFDKMEKQYFNNFLRSDYHCKHQIDVLTSGNVLLTDILYNETALFYFMEFMEQEGNHSLLEFWLASVNFQEHLLDKKGGYNPMEAQNDAIVLYEKYFSLQATSPLGFSDKIRFEVEQNICREDGPLPNCFEKPVQIVLHVLENHYLKPFLTSQLYFKYLSELINTIQTSPSLLGRNRKSGSDCSSELSVSIQNTLLAMEDMPAPRKIIRNVDDREMSIDSRQLYDPDSLWRRRHQSGLSFGKINELGRFETEVEPEPDRKGASRISRVVRKLVNMEEDKAKEEMAWQIAEMIVKDITSMTMKDEYDEES